mgnify:CR=1 FL=1
MVGPESTPERREELRTGRQGQAEADDGEQALDVWASGYTYYSTSLSIEGGQTLVVELQLFRQGHHQRTNGD